MSSNRTSALTTTYCEGWGTVFSIHAGAYLVIWVALLAKPGSCEMGIQVGKDGARTKTTLLGAYVNPVSSASSLPVLFFPLPGEQWLEAACVLWPGVLVPFQQEVPASEFIPFRHQLLLPSKFWSPVSQPPWPTLVMTVHQTHWWWLLKSRGTHPPHRKLPQSGKGVTFQMLPDCICH